MSRLVIPLIVLALLVPTLLMAEDAAAHRQGQRPGYERLLYDCSHDWGWEGGYTTERGHDLVTLDIMETAIDGVPMVLFELNMVRAAPYVFGPGYKMWETIHLTTPRSTIETTLESTGEWAGGLRFADGTEPAYLGPRKAGLTEGGGPDNTLLAYDIGYTYDQLQVQTGENLLDYEVWSYYEHLGQRRGADQMAGGYHSSDGKSVEGCRRSPDHEPARDEVFFRSDGYRITASDWVVGTPPTEDEPPEGGAGAAPAAHIGADFRFTPERPLSLQDITFSETSVTTGTRASSWTWSFGDGNDASGQNVRHLYERPGRYLVALTVEGEGAETAQVTKEVVVQNRLPVAAFRTDPIGPRAGEPVLFIDRSTDEDGEVVAYAWDLGDGRTTASRNVTHVFKQPGTYEVRLVVTDDQGMEAKTAVELTVGAPVRIDEAPMSPGFYAAVLAGSAVALQRRQ